MKKFVLILFSCVLMSSYPATHAGHDGIGDKEIERADAWLVQHLGLIHAKAAKYGIQPRLLMAIVFPEVVRYNAVYDFMETAALSLLYVKSGARYADFSIGHFQMKPSFAEAVEQDASKILDKQVLEDLSMPGNKVMDDEALRRARINKLETVEGQVDYLVAFYLICAHKSRGTRFESDTDRLRYFATCYNSGYRKPEARIRQAMEQKAFHTGKFGATKMYNYSDVSCAWLTKSQLK